MLDTQTEHQVRAFKAHSVWNSYRTLQLMRLWAEGLSASKIALEIGDTTRNAVIGKARRLKLPKHQNQTCCNTVKSTEPRQRKPRPKRIRVLSDRTKAYTAANIDDQAIPLAQRCTFRQLTADTCKWPVGEPGKPDFFFCGAQPLSTSVYCAGHYKRGHWIEFRK